MEINMKSILAGNIARYRKEKGFTQDELASKLGITYQAVSKWETGQTMPDVSILISLAAELQVSVDKLLGYNAYQNDTSYYENVYKNNGEYYWGVNPSNMCLKVIALKPPDKRLKLLDIGCGEGKDAVFFARCGYDVSAFDISNAGIEKTKRLAESARVHVNVFKANIRDYRLDSQYDILYSSGVLHYIKPELRVEIFEDYRTHTSTDGIHAFNVFIQKPFIAPPPEKEEHAHLWRSGQILTYYHDWYVEDFMEYVFECNSSGVPHKHAMNELYARNIVI